MNVAKILTVAVVCLGLGISGAHGVALCFGSDGSLFIEAAVDGACVGAQTNCCADRVPLSGQPGSSLRVIDHGGSCRDVVIGRDGVSAPLPSSRTSKRPIARFERSGGQTSSETPIDDLGSKLRRGGTCQAAIGQRPPPIRTTVLRL